MFKSFLLALAFAVIFPSRYGDWGLALRNMGYPAKARPDEAVRVTVPLEWDGVYENYNAIQREGGFDLRPYRGKNCTRYTYVMDDGLRGNVLVYNGAVIGGDICSVAVDGFMLPLEWDKILRPKPGTV